MIYLITKPDFKLTFGAGFVGSVWKFPQERGINHPAPFPFRLANRCVSSVEGGPVLDPFMGSGTTALAAITNQRGWIGIELSAGYIKEADERIKAHHPTLF